MAVRGMGHINLRASAETIECLRRFYVDAVGLREGPRPVFRSGSSGYWLYAGDRAVLHLTIAQDGGVVAQPRGVFNHLAFDCATDAVDELHQVQLFLTDPAGIGVELTFTHRG